MASTQATTIILPERAQAIVREHGHLTFTTPESVLMGGILFSQSHADGSYTTGIEWTPVPLTIPALRDWLGY